MNKLNTALLVTFLIFAIASVGFVSAQTPGTTTISGTAQVFWDKTPSPGAVVTVTINFNSGSSSELHLYRVGIHTDWQDANQYYTLTFSDLQTVEANGVFSQSVSITIPTNVQIGTHSLTVAVDGYDANGNTFSWDSTPQNFPVTETSTTGSPTNNPNGGSNQPLDLNSLVLYIAIIAVIAVVVILLIVIMVKRRNRPTAASAAHGYAPQPVSSPPPESDSPQPEDGGSEEKPEGKDFNI